MSNQPIHPAGRACLTCAEPLSIHYAQDRCVRCIHSYKLKPLHPLQHRVQSQSNICKLLANVPPYQGQPGA